MEIKKSIFGKIDGKIVELFTVANKHGNSVAFINYGATWVSAVVPEKSGVKEDVVLGYNSLEGYLSDTAYMGATIGRFANRIENATFEVDGKKYKIDSDNESYALHGGKEGFSHRVWDSREEDDGVSFSLISPDGDQGFPGTVSVKVRYRWDDDNNLRIEFTAETDKATPISLANHAYFNLNGTGSILNQQLAIYADNFLPMKEGCIVTGEIAPVQNTPFNFRDFKAIGKDISQENGQLRMGNGYDQSFLIKKQDDGILDLIAEVFEPESGILMQMRSSYPTVHLYSANFLSSKFPGKKGKKYSKREAFCLEAQYSPNAPNILGFPSSILRPGKQYNHAIEFHFSVLNN
ncbi:MAG: galactose mutarotase [Bacteroidales bacterium]|jgi:aldose 1-epimerase|nr:galactose mutarotase [Bacteroidales bacterium]